MFVELERTKGHTTPHLTSFSGLESIGTNKFEKLNFNPVSCKIQL